MKTPIVYTRKVRFSDIDCQGHVFNANYFVYFDDAITDFFEAKGLPYAEIVRRGHDMVLVRAECEFRSSGALGENLSVQVSVEKVGNTSLTFGLRIEEEETKRLVAEGKEIYVILDAATHAPIPVPDYMREGNRGEKPARGAPLPRANRPAVEEPDGEVARWLVKTEEKDYSFADLERDGRGAWDGVRNPQALKNLRAMAPGDGVLVYHSGDKREVVGVASVAGEPYPDPRTVKPGLWVVDVVPKHRLERPVPLALIKAEQLFAHSPLVRQGRLSVVPLTEAQWQRLLELASER